MGNIKDFVPYNESLELKELGFDERCFLCYSKEGELSNAMTLDKTDLNDIGFILAPTFSQAFRWFREKHDLHSCVAPVYEDEISKVIVYWFFIQGFDSFEDEDINYKTHEEAEFACLQQLIQIVKDENSN